jgi:hypothetical protein
MFGQVARCTEPARHRRFDGTSRREIDRPFFFQPSRSNSVRG